MTYPHRNTVYMLGIISVFNNVRENNASLTIQLTVQAIYVSHFTIENYVLITVGGYM
jgi:hypothetical protein